MPISEDASSGKKKKRPRKDNFVRPHGEEPHWEKESTSEDVAKVEMRDRKRKESVAATEETGKKEKKKRVFDLPGQKRPAPSERDPSRIFYETLYKQVPGCELAQIWMMESGLLPRDVAEQVYEKRQRKPSSPTSVADVAVETSVKSEQLSQRKKKGKETRVTVKKSGKHKLED